MHDADGIRWTDEDMYDYLTAACRQLVLLRPGARAVTESVKLSAKSTRQSIPTGGFQLIDIVRNMGADGDTPGYPVQLTERDALDDANTAWHMDGPEDEIDNYTYDEANPTVFYVTPPPSDSVFVEMVYSKSPDRIEAMDDPVVIDNAYEEALYKYIMHKAFCTDDASPADFQKSAQYLSRFYLDLGEVDKAKIAYSPNRQFQPYNGQGGA